MRATAIAEDRRHEARDRGMLGRSARPGPRPSMLHRGVRAKTMRRSRAERNKRDRAGVRRVLADRATRAAFRNFRSRERLPGRARVPQRTSSEMASPWAHHCRRSVALPRTRSSSPTRTTRSASQEQGSSMTRQHSVGWVAKRKLKKGRPHAMRGAQRLPKHLRPDRRRRYRAPPAIVRAPGLGKV